MKILLVNKFIKGPGGVEHYINALAVKLEEKGHEVRVISQDESKKVFNEFVPDVAYLHNLDDGSVINYFAGKVRTVKFVHDYKTVDPDGKMLLKGPLEVNKHPLSPACFVRAFTRKCMPRNPVKAIKAYSRAKSLLGATKCLKNIIVASEYVKWVLVGNGVDPERISVLPYFVDYKPPEGVIEPAGRRMLFAGRIAEGKGLDMLLDILALIKEGFTLDVAGTGPLEKICHDKIKALGLQDRVKFHGWLGREGLAELYKKCSFLVLPSVWPEPFGICGIEAAFFGKPTVAFNVGGISDWLISAETGFLVKPYDKEKMAEKISYLLDNPEKARELGQKAKEQVKKYSPDSHIDKLLRIFKK